MLKNQNSSIRSISAQISEGDAQCAKTYIMGVVHGFCNNNDNQHFSVQLLFGGENKDWRGTPLQVIYEYYAQKGYADAAERAARDVGWLLKAVLQEDRNLLYDEVDGYTKEYFRI